MRVAGVLGRLLPPLVVGGLALGWWMRRVDVADDVPDPPQAPATTPVPAGPRPRVDPRLAAPAGITGTVRGPDGAALAGAHVCAWSVGRWLASTTPTCSDAGPDGFYALEDLPPLRLAIHASAAGHQPASHPDLSLKPGERRVGVDLQLAGGGARVDGLVRDISGGEIDGAWVSNYDASPGAAAYFQGAAAATRSDVAGRFTLWLRPGHVGLFAQADGYTVGSTRGDAPGRAFEIVLTPESVLVGKVVRADTMAPVAGAQVTAISDWSEGGAPSVGVVYTDAAGHFRVPQLQPGRYKPSVEAEGAHGEAERSVHLGLGETSEPLTIRVHPIASVHGRVVVTGGATCSKGEVSLTSRAGGPPAAGILDPDGSVLFPAVQPGTYEVNVLCFGLLRPPSLPPVVVGREPVTGLVWPMERGLRLRGTVVDAHGRPVAGAFTSVHLQSSPQTPAAQLLDAISDATDAAGRFELGGLLPGTYTLAAHAEDQPTPPTIDVTMPAGRDVDGIQIVIPPQGAISGVVVDDRGDPARGAFVLAILDPDDMNAYPTSVAATSGADGSFVLRGVPPGDYRVHAETPQSSGPTLGPGPRPGEVPARVRADESTDVRLVVTGAHGSIAGRVQAPDGSPVTDAFIAVVRETDMPGGNARQEVRWSSTDQPVLTDADGEFVVEGLADGDHLLRAYRRGGGEAFAEHVPVGGRATLTIEPTASLSGELRGEPPEAFAVALVERTTMFQRSEEFFRSEGRWGFEGLPPGSYELIFEGPTGAAKQTVELRADERRDDLRVELTAPGSIRGRVIDGQTQAPVAGVRVQAHAAEGRTRFAAADPTITASDGRFELSRVMAGPAYLSAIPVDPTQRYFGNMQTTVEPGRTVEVVFSLTSFADAPPIPEPEP